MPMNNWEQIRPVVEQVLRQQCVTSSGDHNGEYCFLTAYQIAVLVDKENAGLKGELPIGGKDEGGESGGNSFAKQIAWHLSRDVNTRAFDDAIERRFFSLTGLDTFTFGGGKEPSANEFSMFRVQERARRIAESLGRKVPRNLSLEQIRELIESVSRVVDREDDLL